ncbi:MAG: response regulator [Flavobacteriales bacterium]|jgi:response regulator RpfG family c-di-GMP phosphodiesterase|nr:response regulator [Flavobacteriales bacterium]
MENKKINVLYVDDEVDNLNAFKAVYRRDFNVFIVESAAEGRKILENNEIEVILTDQRMPGMTGVEFLESILKEFPESMRILVTGYADITAVIDAINKGQVYRYVSKPWDNKDLKILIEQSAEVYQLRKEKKQLTDDLIRTQGQLEFMLRQKLSAL